MTGIIEQERYTCAIGAMQTVTAIPQAVPATGRIEAPGRSIGAVFPEDEPPSGQSPCLLLVESPGSGLPAGFEPEVRRTVLPEPAGATRPASVA